VAQLKTISEELNKALGGNEKEVRSVLGRLDEFMGQLDRHKSEIVSAIRAVNRLTLEVKGQQRSIVNALDELPGALKVLNQQRRGLVKMLHGLQRLSPVAVRVIRASKQDTLATLKALDPILTKLADAGDAVPKSMQALLTYPFVDAVVGTSPTEARDLHMGDYTNLAAQLDIDLANLPEPPRDLCDLDPNLPICDEGGHTNPCALAPDLPICNDDGDVDTCRVADLPRCRDVNDCVANPDLRTCTDVVRDVCDTVDAPDVCDTLVDQVCQVTSLVDLCPDNGGTEPPPDGGGGGDGGNGGGGGDDGGILPCDPLDVLCRPGVHYGAADRRPQGVDTDVALLLLQGVTR